MENKNNIELSPAERHYYAHLKNVANYQKNHPEKQREKQKRYMERMKSERPKQYEELLAKRRRKPHNENSLTLKI